VVFTSDEGGAGPLDLVWQAADGTGTAEPLIRGNASLTIGGVSVSPDGGVVFTSLAPSAAGAAGLMLLAPGGDRPQPLLQTQFLPRNAEVSPDGRWLAYEADDSGPPQIYVRPFPAVNSSGRELFYLAPTGAIMGVGVEGGTAWRASPPAPVVQNPYYFATPGRTYDISQDGKRFLVIKPDPEERLTISVLSAAPQRLTDESLIVVQHWTEELKRPRAQQLTV
jgi:hypothetical protein